MTDNEKAATFIGWKDQDTCILCEPNHSMPNLPAPDMSKPENYMRALESLTPHGPWSIGCWDGASIGPFVFGGRKVGPFAFKPLQCGGHVEAVIKALAKLYDAEHPDEARK